MRKNFLQNLTSRLPSRPTSRDLALFAKELRFLLSAGVPLLKCLSIAARQIPSKVMRSSIFKIHDDISAGLSLSQSLRSQGNFYPSMFVNIVEAGEAGGLLEECLSKIAEYFDSKDELRKKIIGSLIYPGIVLSLSLVSIIFVAIYLVPMMNGLFASMGVELPYLTRLVGGFGGFILDFWHLIFILGLSLFFLARFLAKRKFGEEVLERILLKVPIIGAVRQRMILSRISGVLSTLLSAGVPILPSLSIASAAAGSAIYQRGISSVTGFVEEGETLSSAFKKASIFPEHFFEMVSLGESSGRLDEILGDLSGYFGREAESQLKVLASLVEPASTVLVGAAVGIVVFSMFMPIIGMLDALVK
jgi:type IV pilus assembly protein PilC